MIFKMSGSARAETLIGVSSVISISVVLIVYLIVIFLISKSSATVRSEPGSTQTLSPSNANFIELESDVVGTFIS